MIHHFQMMVSAGLRLWMFRACCLVIRDLCVPKTSSESCDQAIFVDQGTGASLFSDAVLAEVDRLG
jgi:hypothetical protein